MRCPWCPGVLRRSCRKLHEALRGVRIVLLGENGHGVKEFTEAKAKLTEWLHRDHGFDVVVFESGLFECDRAARKLVDADAAGALRACLRYPLEHAEALPLFERMKEMRDSSRALTFSVMDFQAQGFVSEPRPVETFRLLQPLDSALGRRLARADSSLYLLPQHGGLGESVYLFAYQHADSLKAEYRRAAALTSGSPRLVFRLVWMD